MSEVSFALQGTMSVSVEDVATVITTVRQSAGLSKRKLAIAAGIEPSEVTRYENGDRVPTLARLRLIFKACGYELVVQAERVAPWFDPCGCNRIGCPECDALS